MSVRHRRLAYLIFAVTCVVAAVTASFAGATTAKKTDGNLVIMGWGPSGDDVKVTRIAMAEKAVDANITNPSGGFNDQQFLAALASGNVPDLVYMPREKVVTYAAKGALQPLTNCISQQKINMKDFRVTAVREVTYAGKVWGLPEFTNPRTVIVNNTAVKDAGLQVSDVSTKDWTKLRDVSKKLMKNDGGNLTRIGFDPKLPEFFPLWAKANGVDILSADGLHAHLNDPRAVAALTYAVALIKLQGGWGKFKSFRDTFDFFGAKNEYAKNQLGAFPMEDWYYNVLATSSPKVKIEAMPFHDKKGQIVNFETGSAWAIPKGSKHPDL